jgi:CRP-like cAMP-binding protein
MSDKIRKQKERASRLAAKGKLVEALDEYQKCVKIEPRDLAVRQKLAETYARLGRREEAIREYQGVAGSYAADGLLLKAIAINKVILTLDPAHKETQGALADLYTTKRGDIGAVAAVQMPKAMSAALAVGKKSASEIRGAPAAAISTPPQAADAALPGALLPGGMLPGGMTLGASGPLNAPRTTTKTQPPPPPDEDNIVDIDAGDIEVLSVESDHQIALGVPVQTNIAELMAAASGQATAFASPAPDIDLDMDVDVVEPTDPGIVVGEPLDALPADEDLLVGDDDGDVLALDEGPAEINPDALPPIPLFSDLPKSAFIELTERMTLHQATAGEILIAEGEYASSMFIVIQGHVKVVRELDGGKELVLAELEDGAFFGEMALLSDAPRTASVIAVADTMLFEISRDLVEEISVAHPSVAEVMRRFHRNRLLTNLLRTSPIFQPFSPQDKKGLIEKFKSRNVESGKTLITHNKQGDGLYVLLSGRCEVIRPDDKGRDVVLAELKDGDVFGEMSALWRRNATASVRTVTPCIVLRLPKAEFDELIMTHPQVLETLSTMSTEREQFNQEVLGSSDDVLNDFVA